MILGALDFEFGFHGRGFDYTTVEPVCGVLKFEDGKTITACPKMGKPWSELEPPLRNPNILIAMHHGAFAERKILQHLGLPFPDHHWWDTELAERVFHIAKNGDRATDKPIKGQGSYTLLACMHRRKLPVRESEAKKALQEKIGSLQFPDSDLPQIVNYCADDCDDTIRLAQLQLADFLNLPGDMMTLYVGLLQPHLVRVADMTSKGILFDRDSYQILKNNQERLLVGMQGELQRLGFQGTFNHVREKLTVAPQNLNVIHTFEALKLHNIIDALTPYKADRDKPVEQRRRSLSGVFKEGHKSPVQFIRAVKDYHDLIGLFATDWEEFIDSDGRIRAATNFPGTSSYRTQQLKPNPLMLPYFARPLFHGGPNEALIEKDFKCQEVGLAADHYGDPKLLQIYNDFIKCLYCEIGVAMGMYPCVPGQAADPKLDEVLRATIKVAILAMQYGGTEKALMEQLNLERPEAERIIGAFWRAFPDLSEGRKLYLGHTRHNKYAINRAGLIRGYRPFSMKFGRLKDSTLSYLNFPVQSGGAAVLMLALAELPDWTNPVLTMHDATLFACPQDAVLDVSHAADAGMQRAMQTLYPQLRCRCETQAAWRYHKKSPDSLHKFAARFGLKLRNEIGWQAHDSLFA